MIRKRGRGLIQFQKDLLDKVFYDPGSRKSINPDEEDFTGGEFTVREIVLGDKHYYTCLCERTVFDKSDSREMVEFGLHYVIGRVQKYEKE